MQKNILLMTQTAMMLALLLVLQWVTKPMGQYVTGISVNLVLVIATLMGGFLSGLTVAAISPLLAFFLGIAPAFIQFVPFIALGNAVLVIIIGLTKSVIAKKSPASQKQYMISGIGLALGAVTKFLVLWLGIVVILIPFLSFNSAQVQMFSAAFGITQLFTALIGGTLAFILYPLIKKALRKV